MISIYTKMSLHSFIPPNVHRHIHVNAYIFLNHTIFTSRLTNWEMVFAMQAGWVVDGGEHYRVLGATYCRVPSIARSNSLAWSRVGITACGFGNMSWNNMGRCWEASRLEGGVFMIKGKGLSASSCFVENVLCKIAMCN